MQRCASFAWWSGVLAFASFGCGSSHDGGDNAHDGSSTGAAGATSTGSAGATSTGSAGMTSTGGSLGASGGAAPIGNAGNGACDVPAAATAEDVSHPTTVVGDGTAASCTADKVVAAVAAFGRQPAGADIKALKDS